MANPKDGPADALTDGQRRLADRLDGMIKRNDAPTAGQAFVTDATQIMADLDAKVAGILTRGAERLREVAARTREPVAGWQREGYRLFLGDPRAPLLAVVWRLTVYDYFWCADGKDGVCVGEVAAQMAAEDVLSARAATITRALAR